MSIACSAIFSTKDSIISVLCSPASSTKVIEVPSINYKFWVSSFRELSPPLFILSTESTHFVLLGEYGLSIASSIFSALRLIQAITSFTMKHMINTTSMNIPAPAIVYMRSLAYGFGLTFISSGAKGKYGTFLWIIYSRGSSFLMGLITFFIIDLTVGSGISILSFFLTCGSDSSWFSLLNDGSYLVFGLIIGLGNSTAYLFFLFNIGTSTGNGGCNFGLALIGCLVLVINLGVGFSFPGDGVGSSNYMSIIFDFPQCCRPLFWL